MGPARTLQEVAWHSGEVTKTAECSRWGTKCLSNKVRRLLIYVSKRTIESGHFSSRALVNCTQWIWNCKYNGSRENLYS